MRDVIDSQTEDNADGPRDDEPTLGSILEAAALRAPDAIALIDGASRVTYRELQDASVGASKAIIHAGAAPGERVAIWAPNSLDWLVLFFGAARAGVVVVPINTQLTIEEASFIVEHSGTRLLFAATSYRGRNLAHEAESLRPASTDLAAIIGIGESPGGDLDLQTFLGFGRGTVDDRRVVASDLALVLYTSGTTGVPKGVMHTHRVIRNMQDVAERLGINRDDTVVLYLPLFHIFAAAAVVTFVQVDGTIVLMGAFDAGLSLDLMESERASVVYGMHTMFYDQMAHASFQQRDLSRVRICVLPGTGADIRAVEQAFGGVALNVYGMTETTSMTSVGIVRDPIALRADTVGYPLPGVEVRIVDRQDRRVPTGSTGEIVVRGHPVTQGYFKQPELTKAAFINGWFHTGDAGSIRPDGYLEFRGRFKEIIRVGGENVDPREVEARLLEHPSVMMAAAVAEPDERLEEVVVAYITVRGKAHAEELMAHCRSVLARFKVPRRIYVLDKFPMTASGKIQKFRLSPSLSKNIETAVR